VKAVIDMAERLRLYSRQVNESLEMQNDIAEIKLRAERRAPHNTEPGPHSCCSRLNKENRMFQRLRRRLKLDQFTSGDVVVIVLLIIGLCALIDGIVKRIR
jgi:hypothetical protein